MPSSSLPPELGFPYQEFLVKPNVNDVIDERVCTPWNIIGKDGSLFQEIPESEGPCFLFENVYRKRCTVA